MSGDVIATLLTGAGVLLVMWALIAGVRRDLRGDVEALRRDMRSDLEHVRRDLAAVNQRIDNVLLADRNRGVAP